MLPKGTQFLWNFQPIFFWEKIFFLRWHAKPWKNNQLKLQIVWQKIPFCNSVYDAGIRQAADGWLDQPGANLKTANFLDVSQRLPLGLR